MNHIKKLHCKGTNVSLIHKLISSYSLLHISHADVAAQQSTEFFLRVVMKLLIHLLIVVIQITEMFMMMILTDAVT